MTVGDLIGNAKDAPLLLLGFGALLSVVTAAAGIIGRRLVASMARQGARVGTLERTLRSERLRRRQLEQCIREQGLELPYWPDDPAELYAAQTAYGPRDRARDYDRARDDGPDWSDPADLVTTFDPLPRVPVPVPPLSDDERAAAARHRRP